MSLITCKACKRQISRRVQSCPQCGHPTPSSSVVMAAALITTIIICVAMFKMFAAGVNVIAGG